MMFQLCASTAIRSVLMPNWMMLGEAIHGTVARSASTTTTMATTPKRFIARVSPRAPAARPRSSGPPEEPGRPEDQHQHEDAEARHVAVRGADVERRQRLDDAEEQPAHDHAERAVESADDRDRERLGGEAAADVRVHLRHDAVQAARRARERGAERERQRVDAPRLDAIEPRGDEVLGGGADRAPKARAREEQP